MAQNYCGKSCPECTRQQELNCPGCRMGPGREFGGSCEIARCARSRGHESCATCTQQNRCGTWMSREHQPDYRIRHQENREAEQRLQAQRAPILGKWLWILFWMIVPSTIGDLLSQDFVGQLAPAVCLGGQLLRFASTIASGLILLKLGQVDDGYRTAGICALIAGGISGVVNFLTGGEAPAWSLLLTLPAAAISLFGQYQRYITHSAMLQGVDHHLSEKWSTLWNWYIAAFVGTFFSAVLVIIPILGILAVLACLIALVVVGILELVYLYRTAKVFREYVPALPEGI